jgi:hypothetical protein
MSFLISFLSTLIILISCNWSTPGADIEVKQGVNKSDTSRPVIISNFQSKAYPQYFEAAFQKDTKAIETHSKYDYYKVDIGKLTVETGNIIACDPISMDGASPFTQIFPKGTFPVQLAMARTENDERVALSRILFSNDPVIKWEFALHNGQKPIQLKDTSFYCYGVDAGLGIFIDSIANNVFKVKSQEAWTEVFINKFYQPGINGFIHEFEGHNLACFSTGYGDGCYATYIGFNAKGIPCQLLTDFALVRWWL